MSLSFYHDELQLQEPSKRAAKACEHNRDIALRLGLRTRATAWSAVIALLPIAHPATKSLSFTNNSTSLPFANAMLASLLCEYLEAGDVLHFVVTSEILRTCNVLREVLSLTGLSPLRVMQANMAYIQMLKQFHLFSVATEIIKASEDLEISIFTKADTAIKMKCGLCCKEFDGQDSWCTNCARYASKCVLCDKPIRGLLHWCPICAHG